MSFNFYTEINPRAWVLIPLLPFVFCRFCSSIDTITSSQPIKDGDLLVSSGGTFALGFLTPGNSRYRYVGIWYKKISVQTVVWVANRNDPIKATTGVMSINKDGDLVIYNQNQSVPLCLTNISTAITASSSYSAQLLDSGNLVLFRGDNASRVVVWESFDYPTHTMLPKMKLGLDRKTGLDRFLISWKSPDDPGTGVYSYRMDPNGLPGFVLRMGTVPRWRTGPWINNKWSGVLQMSNHFLLYASYIDNSDELSIMYGLKDASVVSIMFLDDSGFLRRSTWHDGNQRWVQFWSAPEDRCDYYGRCGAYGNCDLNNGVAFECTCLPGYEPRSPSDWYLRDWSAGCKRKHMANHMCGAGEGFVKVANAKVPDVLEARVAMNLNMEECKKVCLGNCSCLAYTNGGRGECYTWHGDLMDVRKFPYGGLDLYIRAAAIELAQHLKKPHNLHGKKMAIVVTSVIVMLLLSVSLVCWLVKRKTKGATNKFSDDNIIGQGGFGLVYKGLLSTGKEIAVKRLAINSKQGLDEFKNEVILITKLQHRNVVRLLGCCINGEERMLIYEYMANGSLDSFIFGLANTRSKSLGWRRRLDIIVGIAQGLLYLHRDSRLRVIHRDLKVSNILLDDDLNPKISDFGIARAVGGDQSTAKTRRVVGTYGYMSPEYAIDGIFSMKSDIFSFGVMVLEILSCKRNRQFHHPDHDFNLLGHAWKLWIEGKASELLDPQVEGSIPMSEILRCMQVGLLCVQKCPKDRPTMSTVLLMLITETIVLPQPKQPGFYMERIPEDTFHLMAESMSSANEVTVTRLEAR
ncbi:G-type lectin S-receptor-like serine/threonine-protein kinase At4g27290 isoform X4 [Diospyros lotus]|uniref:G-type lectin S-receptor-like serine/threonine-protein kinase At4g27290 isoform X4 n=1 Tax=Diospyros lotus TaxID=55363 RepID=UPI00225207F9|nr:G-type lectin S-receptor-like serine/threonine-protein kinase At4g27290 isoform X4 [Diospyros lotus]